MPDIPQIFELGMITLSTGGQIYVEEITINSTQDLHTYYTTDSFKAKAVRPGRRKYDFTIKKAEDRSERGGKFRELFEADVIAGGSVEFDMTVYAINVGSDYNNPRGLFKFTGCRLSRDNLGNFDASKPVQNDLEGQAIDRVVL
jgi:hypothetical protein